MTVTQLKPDIVVVSEKDISVHLLEWTVTFDSSIKGRDTYKSNKYANLTRVIVTYKATLIASEVGARGNLTSAVRISNVSERSALSVRRVLNQKIPLRASQNHPSPEATLYTLQEGNQHDHHLGSWPNSSTLLYQSEVTT